jgi:hypothetical protein
MQLSLSLTGEQGPPTLFTGQRERERERERGKEGEKESVERGRVREKGRECEKEGEREVEYVFHCPELLFLKGMTGALAP